jgi:integrase
MGRISNFLSQYHSESTRGTYATGVYKFLSNVYQVKIRRGDLESYEALADRYFTDPRDYSEDLITYAGTFEKSPANTARTRVTSVKEFLIFNDVEIKEKDTRTIRRRMPKGGAVTVERDLDAAILQSIIQHCTLWLRAIILLMASSGMRIGEVLNLDISDIDLENDIGIITVRNPKGGMQRYTFCSSEASDAIRAWRLKRPVYLKASLNRGRGLGVEKDPNDPRLFPMSRNNVDEAWENAIKTAGHHSRDRVTNRLQIHPHMLRKFFSSQLSIAVPRDIVELLMGHSGYLSDAYRRYTRKQVEEFYRKGEAYITVQMTDEIRELRTNTDKRMQAHSEIIEGLLQKSINQERILKEQQNIIDTFQRFMEQKPDN